jgi:peptidoglycan hydrolase-like protein with peptidoglycan-binding domain
MLTESVNSLEYDNLYLPNTDGQQYSNFTLIESSKSEKDFLQLRNSEFDAIEELIAVDETEAEKFNEFLSRDELTDKNSMDFLTGQLFSDSEAVLEAAVFQSKEKLEIFANNKDFFHKFERAFDSRITSSQAKNLIKDLVSNSAMPNLEIVTATEINNNADAAFGNETIYIFEEFLNENSNNPEVLEEVILEEIGHYIDKELDNTDSPGDEGNIFSKLVRGETIDEAELTALKNENDSATLKIDGEEINVELSALPFPGEDFIYEGQSSVPYNPDVEAWQQQMAERGWELAVDGKYGPESESIARRFQEAKDLEVDGIVGEETWEATFNTSTPPFPGEDFIYDGQSSVPYNPDVEAWQQQMAERGWELAVDGKYGPESESIARQFQQAKDLDVDGFVGPQTWEAAFNTGTPPFPGEDFIYDGQSSVPYNSDVEAWQQQMADFGYTLAVDGQYGPESESIARQFQENQGLEVDGIVGPQTWEATFDPNNVVTPPSETPPPPPPEEPSPPAGSFQENVVAIAEAEWEFFDRGELKETEENAWQRVVEYWNTQGINDNFGIDTPEEVGSDDNPWSGVFISWVMDQAGAGEEFNYSSLHADYINQAILDRESDAAFVAYDIDEYALQPGDLIGANREGENEGEITVTYDDATNYSYYSHVDIVVATRPGEIDVIGGNVDDSVTLETYAVDSEGKLINPDDGNDSDNFFVVIENRFGEDVPPPPPTEPSPPPESIEFGDYDPVTEAPEFVTDEFLEKVFGISQGLEAIPEYLMAVMGFETGGSYDPAVENPDSSATGLIQFLEDTAEGLGTSTAELAEMTAVEQLDYVEQYYSTFTGELDSLEDTYTAVLAGVTGEDELFVEGSSDTGEAYDANAPLDFDEDGVVTAQEAATPVREYLPGEDLFADYRM